MHMSLVKIVPNKYLFQLSFVKIQSVLVVARLRYQSAKIAESNSIGKQITDLWTFELITYDKINE